MKGKIKLIIQFLIRKFTKEESKNSSKLKKRNQKIIWASHIANLLTAISVIGLSVIGTIATNVAISTIVILSITMGIIGVLGKWLNSTIDEYAEYVDDTGNVPPDSTEAPMPDASQSQGQLSFPFMEDKL